MIGFHHCVMCGGLIWPWQHYGFRVQFSKGGGTKTVHWHAEHWRMRKEPRRRW